MPCIAWFMFNNGDLETFGNLATNYQNTTNHLNEAMCDWNSFYNYFINHYNYGPFCKSFENLNNAFETYYSDTTNKLIVNCKPIHSNVLFNQLAVKMFEDQFERDPDIVNHYLAWWVSQP